jgi:hypothetical protein
MAILYFCKNYYKMKNLDRKIHELETKIDGVTNQIETLADQIATGFELVSKEFESVEQKIDSLKGGSISNLGDVEKSMKQGFADVIAELRKINSITKYEDLHKNLPDFKGKA